MPEIGSARIIYLGTAAIGVNLLRRCASLYKVAGVITAPDRPKGRGKRLAPSPIRKVADELKLNLYQPQDVNSTESVRWCKSLDPDVYILFAYGQILSEEMLVIPRWAVNVHPSLLPAYRGAAPLQRAIMAGEEETGITIITMAKKVDAGGIVLAQTLPIDPQDTYGDLTEHVSSAVPYLVEKAVEGLLAGSLRPVRQPSEGVTTAPKILKSERLVDWAHPAADLHNLIRGLSPEPLAYSFFRHKRLEIVRARIADLEGTGQPGTLVLDSGLLMVQCEPGFLELLEVKPEGKRIMPAAAFVNGYRPSASDILTASG